MTARRLPVLLAVCAMIALSTPGLGLATLGATPNQGTPFQLESDEGSGVGFDDDAAILAQAAFPYRLGLKSSDARGTLRIDPSSSGRPLLGSAFDGSIDLSASFPPIGIQGDQDSCVGWAAAYVRTYYEIRDNGRSATEPVLSPSFIYNQCNSGADNGCSIPDALRVMQRVGIVPLAAFPYEPNGFGERPDAQTIQQAGALRTAGFGRLWARGEQPSTNDLRQSLATGDPVILGVRVYNSDSWLLGSPIGSPAPEDQQIGGHSVVAVGFDDDSQLFKIANTWGTDWGDRGYGYLTYDFVDQGYATEAWVVVPSLSPPISPTPTSPPAAEAAAPTTAPTPTAESDPDGGAATGTPLFVGTPSAVQSQLAKPSPTATVTSIVNPGQNAAPTETPTPGLPDQIYIYRYPFTGALPQPTSSMSGPTSIPTAIPTKATPPGQSQPPQGPQSTSPGATQSQPTPKCAGNNSNGQCLSH